MEGVSEEFLARHRAAHQAKLNGEAPPPRPAAPADESSGPGTELRKLLHVIGIQPKGPKCKCNEHAREMDEKGAEWCEANIEKIVDWLEAEAKTRPIVGILFSRLAAQGMVKLAIRRARAN